MSEITDKIIEDIKGTGFPTEISVSDFFDKRGWSCSENEYYIDQDENKGREIDLLAHEVKHYESERHVSFWSFLSVEIKKSIKPWVIFTSKRRDTDTGGYGLLNHHHNFGSELLSYGDIMKKYPAGSSDKLGRNQYVAFSKGGNPQIYDALLSSTKASIERHRLAKEHQEAFNDTSLDGSFYTPVIVLEGDLFEASLNNESEIEVVPSEHIVFNLNYTSPNYESQSYLVDIVTINGLENYVRMHEEWLDHMLATVVEKME